MPAGVVEDDGLGGVMKLGGEDVSEALVDGVEGVALGGATCLIEVIEFAGEFGGAIRGSGEEELDDVGGDIHATGGVDAGRDAEADLGGCGCAIERQIGDTHEFAEAGLDGIGELTEAERGDDAIFPDQRYGVGDGGDGDELEEAGQEARVEVVEGGAGIGLGPGVSEKEGMGEFEGDGGAAEALEGVLASGLGGVDDGDRMGQAGEVVREVVIGDDEVEAESFGLGRGREGADAGVNGDDEADSGGYRFS